MALYIYLKGDCSEVVVSLFAQFILDKQWEMGSTGISLVTKIFWSHSFSSTLS